MKDAFAKIAAKHGRVNLFLAMLLILFVALAIAGLIPPAAMAAPFMAIGATKVRGAMDSIVTIKYTHTGATTTDTVYLLNGRVMLAMNSAAANALNVYMIGGMLEYATDTGTAWAGGDKIYWDDTNKKFTKTDTNNTLCGIAYEAKTSAAATATILLVPTP